MNSSFTEKQMILGLKRALKLRIEDLLHHESRQELSIKEAKQIVVSLRKFIKNPNVHISNTIYYEISTAIGNAIGLIIDGPEQEVLPPKIQREWDLLHDIDSWWNQRAH